MQVFCVVLRKIKIMPVDRQKIRRIFVIHQKLRNQKGYSWEQLRDAVRERLDEDVSKRTIQYDIDSLREEFNAPISKGQRVYQYTEPFSILEVFDNTDLGAFNELLAFVRQSAKLPALVGMEETILKLEQKVRMAGGESNQFIEFEENERLRGREHLEKLYRAILDQRFLKIKYKPYESNSYDREIFPCYLKAYNNRWNLFAFEENQAEVQNIPLDRILTITNYYEAFHQPIFNPEKYFKNFVGVSLQKDKEIEKVQFKVRKKRANYIETKPIHASQRTMEGDENWIFFEISVIINQELEAKLLEYSSDLIVLKPKSLHDRIKEILKSALTEYENWD